MSRRRILHLLNIMGGLSGGGGCAPYSRIDGTLAGGAPYTHLADGVIGVTATIIPSTSNAVVIAFREVDVSNYWRMSWPDTGTLLLYERVAGSNTLRGSSIGAVTNGARVVVVMSGTSITIYVNGVLKITYASASNFATATAGEIVGAGTGATTSDLKTWTLACRASEGV